MVACLRRFGPAVAGSKLGGDGHFPFCLLAHMPVLRYGGNVIGMNQAIM